jgi:hypothetical protein
MADSRAFGVVGGTAAAPRVDYLADPLPATDESVALAGPVRPTEVFRFAATCAGTSCRHFDGKDCRLVQRIVSDLPVVVDVLPPCRIRSTCRWWKQEGPAACRRCPQVVTESYNTSETEKRVATP